MKNLKPAASVLALIAMTAQASAEAVCDRGASAALKTAAIQQELMVAGLTCGATGAYNRFVLAYQGDLQKSDADLMAYFRNRDGSEAGYDSYKTKLANLAAFRSGADGARYCAATARGFAHAGVKGQTLAGFIAGEHLLIAAPEACAIKYDVVEDAAVEGVPSYALPATPYGAPAPAPSRVMADPDRRQADNDAPPPPARYPRGWANQDDGYYYAPYGWLPPRPPRGWAWYGGAYND